MPRLEGSIWGGVMGPGGGSTLCVHPVPVRGAAAAGSTDAVLGCGGVRHRISLGSVLRCWRRYGGGRGEQCPPCRGSLGSRVGAAPLPHPPWVLAPPLGAAARSGSLHPSSSSSSPRPILFLGRFRALPPPGTLLGLRSPHQSSTRGGGTAAIPGPPRTAPAALWPPRPTSPSRSGAVCKRPAPQVSPPSSPPRPVSLCPRWEEEGGGVGCALRECAHHRRGCAASAGGFLGRGRSRRCVPLPSPPHPQKGSEGWWWWWWWW